MTRFTLVLIVGLLFAPSCVDAQVYRWVDDQGRVHFSDHPPPGREAERVAIESRPTDLEATLIEQIEREERLRLIDEDRADDAADEAANQEHRERLARACEQARARVARIESARRLSRVEEDGSRHVYNDEERQAALLEARGQVSEWCR